MPTEQQKAEAYVREKLPELMELSFGCEVQLMNNLRVELGPFMTVNNDFRARDASGGYADLAELDMWIKRRDAKIIGHPPQLQHWLWAMDLNSTDQNVRVSVSANAVRVDYYDKNVIFIDGKPATEADYKAFNDIVCHQRN